MNGIIHGCTHPNHLDVSDVLSERDMMLGIMHYIDRIITQIVKPKVSVYMAIDGVAPRAKLNQQRSRRFRSAMDLAEATKGKNIKSADENAPGSSGTSSGAFDSNCITPGTEFMGRVSAAIKYFIRKKIKEDPLWRNLKIIFSGQEIPGEGEHKIMQHIREMRNQPGYQPNTRHCMYGQDADLIMLGLVSHEPHFTLLREIVDFTGGFSRNANALKTVKKFTKQSDFQLLHLSVLREYLQIEFAYNANPASFDLERIIDDFVFMTFLVGNDFLPHMPSLDIGDGAFDLLFGTYKAQRPTWGEGEYLTKAGEIVDASRLEAFIAVIGAAENEILEQREENEAVYLKKKRKWDKRDGKAEGPSDAQLAAAEASARSDYLSAIETMMSKNANATYVKGWAPPTDPSEKDFKGRYYFEKLTFLPIDIDRHALLRKSYIEGLMWCLAYYYRGCISWGWFYPYHYGPMLSDLVDLPEVFESIEFEVGAPLKPFEQLMACLPPASSILVPRPYRKLMCSPDSPIIHFYPEKFDIDMNGKRNPWEGVNILPFIDVLLLKDTIKENCSDKLLSPDEKSRNSRGKVFCYSYDAAITETVPSCNRDIGLPDITKCNSRVDIIEENYGTDVSFNPELIPGTQIPYPGYPSLNVLPIENAEIIPIGLNCFGMQSKYPNTVLTLRTMPELPGAKQIADNIIGKSVFVNWPMMHEAKVAAVSDATCEVRFLRKAKKIKSFKAKDVEQWHADTDAMAVAYLNGTGVPGSGGVNIGDIQIRLKVLPLQGMRINLSDGSSKKVFGKTETDVPLQMALWQAPAPDPRFIERSPMTLKERFPAGCRVVLTKGKHRGCIGTTLGALDDAKVGVRVEVLPPEPPFGLAIARSVQESFISSPDAAKILKINPGLLGKIAGSLFVDPGRYDLGLNLKYKESLCVLGYTRGTPEGAGRNTSKKKDGKKGNAWKAGDSLLLIGGTDKAGDKEKSTERILWEYTPKAIRLIAAYRQKFPMLFAGLAKAPNERFYNAKNLLGPKGDEMLPKIREWLNNVETAKIPRTPCSTEAMPYSAVSAVQRAADVRTAAREKDGSAKQVNIKIPSSALYREGSTAATDVLDASAMSENSAPELGDRIVNLCANGVPFGMRGTVVSIHEEASGCVEVVMDEEFIGGSTLQGMCGNFRGKLVVWNHLLKISAADSKGVVDQIIPTGSGKDAIKELLEKTKEEPDRSMLVQKATLSSSFETAHGLEQSVPPTEEEVDGEKKEQGKGKEDKLIGTGSGSRALTPSRGGTKGGKQGLWMEAKKPEGKGVGFKNVRRGQKSGYEAWRKSVGTGMSTSSRSKGGSTTPLGVGKGGSDPTGGNATAGLKAMLGISHGQPAPLPPPPPPPPRQPTAADALFAMMMNQPPQVPPSQVPPQQHGFNFTYLEEGEEAPQSPPGPEMPVHSRSPNPPYPMPTPFIQPGTMPAGATLMYPVPGPSSIPPNAASAPIPPKREKKKKQEKQGGTEPIIPAVVASKGKK